MATGSETGTDKKRVRRKRESSSSNAPVSESVPEKKGKKKKPQPVKEPLPRVDRVAALADELEDAELTSGELEVLAYLKEQKAFSAARGVPREDVWANASKAPCLSLRARGLIARESMEEGGMVLFLTKEGRSVKTK